MKEQRTSDGKTGIVIGGSKEHDIYLDNQKKGVEIEISLAATPKHRGLLNAREQPRNCHVSVCH